MNARYWLILISTALLPILALTGCNNTSATPIILSTQPTSVKSTTTPMPSPTAAASTALPLTPTLVLPVLAGTPVPLPQEPIAPDNVDGIQQLALWGQGQVKRLNYSSDGKFLVVGSTTGLWLYDAKTLELLRFTQTADEIMDLIFLPDSETVMALVGNNTVIRWEVTTGALLSSWQVGVTALRNTAFAPNGKILASALEDGQVDLWDIESGRLLKTLKARLEPQKLVTSLAFSPDGTVLASTATNNTIQLWQVETANLLLTLPSHNDSAPTVFKLLFSPDGTTLASVASDIRLWQVKTGELLQILSNEGGRVLTFSADSTMLATAGYEALYIWNIESKKLEHTLATRWISDLAFSPMGETLVSGGADEPVHLWNSKTGEFLRSLESFGEGVLDMEVSPDGSIFTTHRKENLIQTGQTRNGIREGNIETGQVKRTIGPTVPAFRLALSANGQVLASSEHDGFYHTGENPVRIWDVPTGEKIQEWIYGGDLIDLALSPDGRLVSVAWSVLDVQTGEVRYDLKPDLREIRHVVFSPDGKSLAYTLDNGIANVVEAETGELRQQLAGPAIYFDNGLAFSPDSKILAVGYEAPLVYLWDIATGAALQTLATDGNQVASLAFTPDGRLLASGSKGSRTIQLWNGKTGQLLYTIDTPEVNIIHFALEGRLLVVEVRDGTIQLWGVPPK